MIELPEAMTLARQMSDEMTGKRIESAVRGNSPHKFAFYTRPSEDYETILTGKTIGEARVHGSCVNVSLEPGFTLVLGGGGERIRLHADETTLPKKHQLLLRFEDGSLLTVTIQGWGSVSLYEPQELDAHPYHGRQDVSPLSDAFTPEHLAEMVGTVEPEDSRSVKAFIVSEPGIWGVGNGYLQDILFRAKLHPRRKAATLSDDDAIALHAAMRDTIRTAVDMDGRDTEFDLHGQRGTYVRLMDSRRVAEPCPECTTPIEKIQYLGGACYLCPDCQV